jgi:hypothetical protein
MNKLDEILAEWKKDSEIDLIDLASEIQKVPKLHSKYLEFLSFYRLKAKECETKYSKLYLLKFEHQQGHLDLAELKKLGWEPIFHSRMKTDVPRYLEADEDLIKLKLQISFYNEIVAACESIMKELNARNYSLKALIDWTKFTNGS